MTIDTIIKNALIEDIREGDHTSLATIPAQALGKAVLIAKEAGIIAGISVAEKVFKTVDEHLVFIPEKKDGDVINVGDKIFTVTGKSISILSAERLALNFMQRMSGIATATHKIVQLTQGTNTRILDTRKTTPNLRILEKEAVRLGGGENHRMGLYDMIMIKDNHIDFAGGIDKAIEACHKYLKDKSKDLKIEIEVRDFNELQQVLSHGGIDRIMLDNFTPQDMKKALAQINGRFETEASGGITSENIRSYAETGVDFISVGALTHHIKSLDLSLKAIKE
ncbi:MAG: nicotinate-nucleotide diphosphorylase (carboxylating) [Bacteroidetes bacterium HGW-Bacteroidetes-17]|jgi:nicotinate-nucleotide pyrophosphorylase (carboxylating)|nr:MAG: nicotinate-nucleotide diphosphorylase (carboxylating) [Bacteroidetes bacterium HGW-Bacteroidetes-17]